MSQPLTPPSTHPSRDTQAHQVAPEAATNKQKQRQKKKGPVRTEAIIPLAVVLAVIWGYFALFFDGHLRRALEYGATAANGAEVNLASLRSSFWNNRVQLTGLQVTDKANPAHNALEIGSIAFDFSWDALLRMKLVSDEISIEGIAWDTARQSPGRVLPVETQEEAGPTLGQKLKDASKDTGLGRIAEFVTNFDAKRQLGELQELKSVAAAKALQTEVNKALAALGHKTSELEKAADISEMKADVERVNVKSQDPVELKKSLDALVRLKSAGEQKTATLRSSLATLRKDLDTLKGIPNQLESAIDEDKKALYAKLNVPSLDANGLTTALLGEQLAGRVQQLRGYIALARRYAPKKGKAAKPDEVIEPEPRAVGRTFHFPRTRGYPEFWLRKGKISSVASADGRVGGFTGELKNLSNDQAVTGEPFELELSGGFPQQNITGVTLALTADHRHTVPTERLRVGVGSFPLGAQTWAKSDSYELGLAKAHAAVSADATISGDTLVLTASAKLRDASYTTSAKSKVVAAVLDRVTQRLHGVDISAKASGSWGDLDISLQSNLGTALTQAFEDQLKDELGKVRKSVEDRIEAQVAQLKRQLFDSVNAGGQPLEKRLSGVSGGIEGLQKSIEDKRKQVEAALKRAAGDKLKGKLPVKLPL